MSGYRTDKSCTVSGGFAVVQPGSQLSINAVEGYALDDFSADVRTLDVKPCELLVLTLEQGREEPDFGGSEDCKRQWKRTGHR